MKVKSFAKINLTLDVKGKDENYHFVDTILHEIDLHDELTFQTIDSNEILIQSNDQNLPLNEQNTVYQAAVLLDEIRAKQKKEVSKNSNYTNKNRNKPVQVQHASSSNPGIKIHIQKNIPVSSGLGGGSSNAATTLKAMNQLWELNLSNHELKDLAAQIGMDTPFFIEGGTAFGTHYGEKSASLPAIKLPPHLIILDDQKQSTSELYKKIDSSSPPPSPNLPCSPTFPVGQQGRLFHNDFDPFQSQKTHTLQKKLLHLGATVVHICGSGPALYALFTSETQKRKAFKELKGQVGFIWESL